MPQRNLRKSKNYVNEVKKNQSTWRLIFELIWRDYFTFRGMLLEIRYLKQSATKKVVKWENDLVNLSDGAQEQHVSHSLILKCGVPASE